MKELYTLNYKNMFLQGEIVKSKDRTEKYPLFLMVLFDPNPSGEQFKAVVLIDRQQDGEEPGTSANNWNKDKFQLSNWEELKSFI